MTLKTAAGPEQRHGAHEWRDGSGESDDGLQIEEEKQRHCVRTGGYFYTDRVATGIAVGGAHVLRRGLDLVGNLPFHRYERYREA